MHVHTPSSHDHTSLYVHIISAAVHIMSHMQWCNVMWSHLWPQHISIRFWPLSTVRKAATCDRNPSDTLYLHFGGRWSRNNRTFTPTSRLFHVKIAGCRLHMWSHLRHMCGRGEGVRVMARFISHRRVPLLVHVGWGLGQVAPWAMRFFYFRPEGTPQPGSGADRARDRTKWGLNAFFSFS